MITTSDYTAEARKYVQGIQQQVILVNGAELARLMLEFGVGATPVGSAYVLKRVDLDIFGDV
jgi:restriction system protein